MKHTVEEVTLSTGTSGLLINVASSEVVNVRIYFRAGFQFGDFSKYEIPHVLEHITLSASRTYPNNNQLRAEMTKYGAHYNASTNNQYVSYLLEAADFDFERCFKLFREGLVEPIFSPETLKAELGNVRAELTSNLSNYARRSFMMSATANFPKIYKLESERIDQLRSIDTDDISQYFTDTHVAHNGGFVVAGATEQFRAIILRELELLFSQLPVGSQRDFHQEPGLGQTKPLVQVADIETIYYYLAWYTRGGEHQEQAALDLLVTILTSGWGSRIFGKARNEGVVYSVGSGYDHNPKASQYSIRGSVNPDKIIRLYEIVAAEVLDIVENGVPQAEIEKAVAMLRGDIKVSTQTTNSVSSWYASEYANYDRVLSYSDYDALLEKITTRDIQTLAKKLFLSKRHSASFYGPLQPANYDEILQKLTPIWK